MAETSLTITFVTSAEQAAQGGSVSVELDSVYNNSKTQFLYGEKCYYKIFTYPILATLSQISSAGVITNENSGYTTVTEQIVFSNSNTSSVSYPVNNIVSSNWLGRNLGSVSASGTVITSSQSGVGVLEITYRTYYRRYAISVPTKSNASYKVLVYITAT